MIADRLENIMSYASLNPFFPEAFEFILNTDLSAHELGKVVIKEGDCWVNFAQGKPKGKENAKIETHNYFIDVQIPVTGDELMGYMPRVDLPEEEYNEVKDATYYKGLATDYLTIKKGMFAIFFPQDAHAPGVNPEGVKRVVIKVRVK